MLFKRFRNTIRKHDLDPRYSDQDKSKIADQYLNLILQCLEHLQNVESAPKEEKNEYLLCVMWVVHNSSQILQWLNRLERKKILQFFHVLSLCVSAFQVSFLSFKKK